MYFVYVETAVPIDTKSEQEAKEKATKKFIELLQNGQVEFNIEWECPHGLGPHCDLCTHRLLEGNRKNVPIDS